MSKRKRVDAVPKPDFQVPVGVTIYSVFLLNPALDSELHDKEGYCDYGAAKIVLNANLAPSRIPGVLFHELMHAAIFESGCHTAAQRVLRVGPESWDDVEEVIISTVSPVLLRAIYALAKRGEL